VYQAGTLSGNPLSVAAGLATLRALRASGAYDTLEERGAQLEAGLAKAAVAAGMPLFVQRAGSMLTPFFTDAPVQDLDDARTARTDRYAAFFTGMLGSGIYLPPSQFEASFVSLAHIPEDIDQIVDTAGAVLSSIDS
jgi:glutamate-1-semialdehyde 2,1-aminomutase